MNYNIAQQAPEQESNNSSSNTNTSLEDADHNMKVKTKYFVKLTHFYYVGSNYIEDPRQEKLFIFVVKIYKGFLFGLLRIRILTLLMIVSKLPLCVAIEKSTKHFFELFLTWISAHQLSDTRRGQIFGPFLLFRFPR